MKNPVFTVKFEKQMDISYDGLVNLFSMLYCCSYWGRIEYDRYDYKEAKEQLQAEKHGDGIYFEDVIIKILENGNELIFVDIEDGSESYLTLNKLMQGISKHLSEANIEDFEDIDGDDADCIFQYALFDDVVYG